MVLPTIQELTKGEYNRFQLVIAVAKGARLVTDEYNQQRDIVESLQNKEEGASSVVPVHLDPELSNEKTISIAVNRIYSGQYKIVKSCDDK